MHSLAQKLHVAIIMDGNGRWATSQGLPRLAGHQAGVEALLSVVRAAPSLQIGSLTLYAFAIANWKRDPAEVEGLWTLFGEFFDTHIAELITEGVRIRLIGNRAGLPAHILAKAKAAEQRSVSNETFLLQVALNYDGVDEVARFVQRTIAAAVPATAVTPEYVLQHLDTEPIATPDIVIRTGMPAASAGLSQWRSSAFLPLQSAQSVCVSTAVLWPDFTSEHIAEIITYAKPDERLFGGQR